MGNGSARSHVLSLSDRRCLGLPDGVLWQYRQEYQSCQAIRQAHLGAEVADKRLFRRLGGVVSTGARRVVCALFDWRAARSTLGRRVLGGHTRPLRTATATRGPARRLAPLQIRDYK